MATITDQQLAAIQQFAAAFSPATIDQPAKKGPGRPRKEPASVQAVAPATVPVADKQLDWAKLKPLMVEKTIPVEVPGISGSVPVRADCWAASQAEPAKWLGNTGTPNWEQYAVALRASRIEAAKRIGLDWTKFVK